MTKSKPIHLAHVRPPFPLGSISRLYFERAAAGGYHGRKCVRPVVDLTGRSPEELRVFVAASLRKCIQVTADQTLRHA